MSAQLTAAERVAIARNPQRPNIMDYIGALFTDFFECKGDRLCGEDGAIVGGVALYHVRPAGRFRYAQTRAARPSDRERR